MYKTKQLVNTTCKLGTKGCFEDGRCHVLTNCKNKITTNADRIRSMTDEELAEFLDNMCLVKTDFHCEECNNPLNCDVCYLDWLQLEAE